MKNKSNFIALTIPVAVVLTAVIWMVSTQHKSKNNIIVGTFEAPTVDVSSEIPGRIDSIYVDLGDSVQKGQLLATLDRNIMDAKLAQAEGVRVATASLVKKVQSGVRKELVHAARNEYLMAKSQYEFADKTYHRYQVLYADSIISKQEMDRIKFKHTAAKNQMEAAESKYKMAQNGATPEELKMVEGKLEAAKGVYQEAEAYYKQLRIVAPVSGEISEKIGAEGEVMKAGYPVLTLARLNKIYAVVNVKENQLNDFKMGKVFTGKVPGLGEKSFRFKVSYMAPMADFATWVPTHEKGDFDLKTFEVRLLPVKAIIGLRPGMSLQLNL